MDFLWKYSIIKFPDKSQFLQRVKKNKEPILFLDLKILVIVVLFSLDILRFTHNALRFTHADVLSSDSFYFLCCTYSYSRMNLWIYHNFSCIYSIASRHSVTFSNRMLLLAFTNHAAWTLLFMSLSARVDTKVSLKNLGLKLLCQIGYKYSNLLGYFQVFIPFLVDFEAKNESINATIHSKFVNMKFTKETFEQIFRQKWWEAL